MKRKEASGIMLTLLLTSMLTLTFNIQPVTANEGIEYFIKLSSDRQTLYLQDTYTDPGLDNVDIVLISTSQLNGHAISKLDDGTVLYDEENSIYKMWVVASTGPNSYWSVYYAESDSLLSWNAKNIQECYYGVSDYWDITRQNCISVLKDSISGYKMWFQNYQADGWKTQIWYRSSVDGITWTEPQLVIGAVPLDDWGMPTALHLTSGDYRLYYHYIYDDVYDFIYLYRADVEPDGVTTSDITQIAKIPFGSWGIRGATIIGNQNGDSHHRVWLNSANDLLRYDSFDEGQSWTVTNMGTYNATNYTIVEAYYGAPSPPPPTYTLTITVTAGGTTNPIPGTYTYPRGQIVYVEAIPSSGYMLDYWELDGTNVGSTNPITVTMDANHTLHAVFRLLVHDVAITNITPSKTVVRQGYSLNINVTAANQGDFTENFNVTLYTNSTGFRRPITITERSGNTLADYQVLLSVDTESLISAGKMRPDGGDIRFKTSTGSEIPYWIESGINTTNTKIWIKVPSIAALGSTTMYMYYGNLSATSTSNGAATFLFFDDFNDGIWTDWIYREWPENGGSVEETNGYIHLSRAIGYNFITAKNFFLQGQPIIYERRSKSYHAYEGYAHFESSTTNDYVRLCYENAYINHGLTAASGGDHFGTHSAEGYNYVDNQWKYYQGVIDGTSVICKRGDSYGNYDTSVSITMDASFNDYDYNNFYHTNGYGDLYIDWEWVRKYTPTEPTIQIGEEEPGVSQSLTLESGASTTITFAWNTTGVAFGSYTISAYATLVPGETDTANNIYTDGTVMVVYPSDLNEDGVVDIVDAALVSAHWYPGPPIGPLGYDPNYDINGDGAINVVDLAIVSAYWTGPPKGPLDP